MKSLLMSTGNRMCSDKWRACFGEKGPRRQSPLSLPASFFPGLVLSSPPCSHSGTLQISGEGWPTVRCPRVPGSRKGPAKRARARRRGGVGAASQASRGRGADEAARAGGAAPGGGVWRWSGPEERAAAPEEDAVFRSGLSGRRRARGETGRKGRRRRQPSS